MAAAEQLIATNLDIWSSAIKTKSAAGRGNSKKLELYGIKKLRELILELAVRGLLVPQDPNDEPASELLKKIAAEKAHLIKEGKVKKTPSPSKKDVAPLFDIPASWGWARLSDIGSIFNGNSVNARTKAKKYTGAGGLPYIATKDVGYGFEPLEYANGISIPVDEPKFKVAQQGAVLICSEGGSAGRKCGVTERDICFGNKLYANQLFGGIESNYILSLYLTPSFFDRFAESMTGIIGGISTAKFMQLPAPIPPLAEQACIVAKVDELMALCVQLEQQQETSIAAHQTLVQTLLDALTTASERDGFTAAWARIADHFDTLFTTEWSIDKLKQTILQLAVMGKLVAQDPNDEPACELLKKLGAEKVKLVKGGKIKKQKAMATIEEDERPFDLPQGWEWARLSDVGSVIDPNPSHRMPGYVEEGIPFISTENFTDRGIDFSIGKKVEKSVLEEQVSKFDIRDGSFAMSRIGTIGKTMFLPKKRDYCMSHALCVISPYLDVFSHDYLKFVVSAESSLSQAHTGVQSIGVPDLGMGVIRSLLIPVPPLGEQDRVVTRMEELMALCDTLKKRLNTAQTAQLQLADAMAATAVA